MKDYDPRRHSMTATGYQRALEAELVTGRTR
jgi:hypothetical protein